MTASGESNNAGLHKQWLERKLEIEVGKVQAKLLSKGLTVPVPNPEALETEARLAQSHLPKLYIELYDRNPNGTLKLSPDPNQRKGPLPPATLVQKLDRMLNPALLTPIPLEVAMAHGLPLSCCDNGGDLTTYSGALTARGGGGGGGGRGKQDQALYGGGPVTDPGSSPRTSRSPPPSQPHCRPDLRAADARIDDAVAEVHRVALQANGMSPRDRVLFLARQANPNFCLPQQQQQRSVQLGGVTSGGSRRELLRKSFSRRVTSFTREPSTAAEAGGGGGGGGGGRQQRLQASASRRVRDASSAPGLSPSPSGGSGAGADNAGEGSLPPLMLRSRSVSRASSSSRQAAAAAAGEHGATGAAAAAVAAAAVTAAAATAAAAPVLEGPEAAEALPRLSPSVSPVPSSPPCGREAEADDHGPLSTLPKLPPVHSGAEVGGGGRASLTSLKPDSLIGMWGAAAIIHAAEVTAAREAAAAEALAAEEAEAEAAEEAAVAAVEAEAEASAAAAEAALEVEVEAEARAAAGLLSRTPTMTDGGAAAPRPSGSQLKQHSGGGAGGHSGHAGAAAAAATAVRRETHGSAAAPEAELNHSSSHRGSSSWMP